MALAKDSTLTDGSAVFSDGSPLDRTLDDSAPVVGDTVVQIAAANPDLTVNGPRVSLEVVNCGTATVRVRFDQDATVTLGYPVEPGGLLQRYTGERATAISVDGSDVQLYVVEGAA